MKCFKVLLFCISLLPILSQALPSAITRLNVKIDDSDREVIIVHDIHCEDALKENRIYSLIRRFLPRSILPPKANSYLKQWDTIVTKYHDNFTWLFEGPFNNFMGHDISNGLPDVDNSYHASSFMNRPCSLLDRPLTSACVDVRVLGRFYYCEENDGENCISDEWELLSLVLQEAFDVINRYGSDTAKLHAQAVINLTQQAAQFSADERKQYTKSLFGLYDNYHFAVVALASLLQCTANYPQPPVLICGSRHARMLIDLLCANNSAVITEHISSAYEEAYNRLNITLPLVPKTFEDVLPVTGASLLATASIKESDVLHWLKQQEQLSSFVAILQVEQVLQKVAQRNPVKHSPLRSRL